MNQLYIVSEEELNELIQGIRVDAVNEFRMTPDDQHRGELMTHDRRMRSMPASLMSGRSIPREMLKKYFNTHRGYHPDRP